MAILDLKTREQIVTDSIAAAQAALPGVFQFTVGSIILAIMEAESSVAVWEESLIQFVLARTRLATSEGHDADTFVQDFGYARPPAIPSEGNVTFSSFSSSTQRIIYVGSIVSTQVGSIQFAVIADTSNLLFNPTLNAYVVPINTASASIPVQCATPGIGGNVAANTINIINSPITGIDTVINPVGFTNGSDAPNDTQLRVLFVEYLNGLKRATKGALQFAIQNVQADLGYVLAENINFTTGDPQPGYFFAVLDNGSGSIPQELKDAVSNSLDVYRGFTIAFSVEAAIPLYADITASVIMPTLYSNADLQANIITALQTYISLIPIFDPTTLDNTGTLFYSRVSSIIYQVIVATVGSVAADSFNVTGVLVNGATADLTSTYTQKLYPGTMTIILTNA